MQQTLINYCVLFYGFISEPYLLQIMSDESYGSSSPLCLYKL